MQADIINTDPTWGDEAFSWTAVECGMYFSAACLIDMRPLLTLLTNRFRKRIGGGSTNHTIETSSGRPGDNMRLKVYGTTSQYNDLDTENDNEIALRSGNEPLSSLSPKVYGGHPTHQYKPSSTDIRVETNIEIRRGDRTDIDNIFP